MTPYKIIRLKEDDKVNVDVRSTSVSPRRREESGYFQLVIHHVLIGDECWSDEWLTDEVWG